jgi:hypothetical protein
MAYESELWFIGNLLAPTTAKPKEPRTLQILFYVENVFRTHQICTGKQRTNFACVQVDRP